MPAILIENLAWIIPSIIAFFLLVNYWRFIYLSAIKLMHGSFSTQYVVAHKRLLMSHPYPQSIKDDFINHVVPFFKEDDKMDVYTTGERIEYMGFAFGSGIKELLRYKKSPGFLTISNTRKQNVCAGYIIKIFGYTEDLFNTQVRLLFYFIKEKFFMGEIYLSDSSAEQADFLCKILAEKYKLSGFTESNDFLINGPDGTSINYKNTGFSLMIRYFNINDAEVARSIKDCVASFVSLKDTTQSDGDKNWSDYI
jgi:hypothetical protein